MHEPIRYILAAGGEQALQGSECAPAAIISSATRLPPICGACIRELQCAQAARRATQERIPNVQVMAEMAKPRDTFILARGDYRNQTEKVTPAVPALFPPLPKDAPANRLSLAQWLFSPQQSADGARRGQPLLAALFRHRPGEDHRGFRLAGRCARAARVAGLAGHRIPDALGRQGDAAPDRHLGHVPPGVAASRRNCSRRTRRIGCWRADRASACPPRWYATTRSRPAAC